VGTLVVLSCIGDSAGPGVPRRGMLAIAPTFQSSAAPIVAFNAVRIRLQRLSPSTAFVLDTTIPIPSPTDTVDLSLPVPLNSSSETFLLYVALINAAGDTVFRNQPYPDSVEVTAGAATTPETVPIAYTGVGSDAALVEITSPAGRSLTTGDTVQLTAVARDSQGAVIPGTPIAWGSLDTARASVPDPALSTVLGRNQRGVARIRAHLLTGQSDTTTVQVFLPPVAIAADTSPPPSPPAGSPTRATVLVTASDGLGVAGVAVQFAVTAGGGTLSQAADTTDSTGRAGVTWTLGPSAGVQSLQASRTGLTGSPVTFSPNAQAATPDHLAFTVQPSNVTAGAAITPAVRVTVQDARDNTVTGYAGDVTVAIGTNPSSDGQLFGTRTLAAVAGVATFSDLTIDLIGVGYTLTASGVGVPTGATSASFTVTAGAAAVLAQWTGNSQIGLPGAQLAESLVVQVRDTLSNPVPGVSVDWTILTGAGSLSTASSLTDPQGLAFVHWTLGGSPGSQQAQAAVAGLAGSPVVFGATAVPPGTTKTWTGGFGTDWANPGNWSPSGVPAGTDNVFVPATGSDPVLSASQSVNALTVEAGVTVLVPAGDALTVSGSLDASSATIGGAGLVQMGGTGVQIFGGTLPSLLITGTVQTAMLTVNGDLTISAGNLTIGPTAVTVNGNFSTTATGTLTMLASGAELIVSGDVTFAGGSEAGLLAAPGPIQVGGDFTQVAGTSPQSFAPSGLSPQVWLTGTNAQTVSFATPGPSSFGTLAIQTAADSVLLATDLVAQGVSVTSGVPLAGPGRRLTVFDGGLTTSGALRVDTLEISCGLNATGPYSVPTTILIGGGSSPCTAPALPYQDLIVTGPWNLAGGGIGGQLQIAAASAGLTVAGPLTVGSDVRLDGDDSYLVLGGGTSVGGSLAIGVDLPSSNTQLSLNGQPLTVSGDLVIGAGAAGTSMTNPLDTLRVLGSVVWEGSMSLSAGVLMVARDFTQVGGTFAPAGSHRTVLIGNPQQSIAFASPGPSHFHDLEVRNTALVLLGSNLVATGQLISPAGLDTVGGGGFGLVVAGLDVDGLVLDNLPLTSTNGTITRFDNVTLQNYDPAAVQLTVAHPGAATPFTFTNARFLTTPGSGAYLSATDNNTGDGNTLAINMQGSQPASGTAYTLLAGGAVVNWAGLAFTQQPINTPIGGVITPAVQVAARDALGNIDTGFTGNVVVSLTGGPGILGGTLSKAAVAGVATFDDLTVDSAGAYQLVALADGFDPVTSITFNVTPAGTTKQWLGGSTDWLDPANWSPSGVPAGTDNVFVGVTANNPTLAVGDTVNDLVVQNGATLTVNSAVTLRVGGDLSAGSTIVGPGTVTLSGAGVTLSGTVTNVAITGSVTASGPITVAGTLSLSGGGSLNVGGQTVAATGLTMTAGTLTGAGTVSVSGTMSWSGGTMSGTGVTSIAPGGTLAISGATAKTLSQRTLENGGTAVWTGTGALGVVNVATINNLAGAVFDHQSDAVLTSAPLDSATVNNAGTWRKSASTGVSFLQDQTFNNSGTVEVLAGTWEQRGGGTSTGAFTVAAGAVLQFDGTVLQQLGAASSVTGAGTVRVNGSGTTTAVRVGPYNITGTTEVLNGGIAFNGTDTARTRVLVESGGNVAGTGILAVSDTFRWSGGQQSTTGGVTTILPGARLEISGATTKVLSQRTLENGGTAVWIGTGPISVVNLATINNLAGALFDIQNDATISSTLLDSVTVNNTGIWRKSAGTGVSLLSNLLAFENLNLGTVDVATGTLRVNGGTFRNRTGATLQGLGTFDRASAAFLGNGLVLPGAASLAGRLSFTGAYPQGATGALTIELGGVTPVTQHDQLAASGAATLGGTLNVSPIGGFVPTPGDTFTVMTFASRTGTFSSVTGLTIGSVTLDTVFDATSLKLVAPVVITVHATDITANETWTAAASPHEVTGFLKIRNGATLTIEDGAEVRFNAGAGLQVGDTALAESGGLVMSGTPGSILLTADTVTPSAGFWRGIEVQRLAVPTTWTNVDIEWGGSPHPGFPGPSPESCLLVANNQGATLTLDSVTMRHCVHANIHHFGGNLVVKRSTLDSATGSALHADFNATLEVDSTVFSNAGNEGLQISNPLVKLLSSAGNQILGNAQRSINIFAEQLPGLGRQTAISGNGFLTAVGDSILVNGGRADTTVGSFTIFSQPAPYLLPGLLEIGRSDPGGATVTLDSGLVMVFTGNGGFQVGDTSGSRRGQIRSLATVTSPALIRARSPASPFGGLGLGLSAGPDSLRYVSVLHGGNGDMFGPQLAANIMVHASSGANPVHLESVIAASGPAHGITVVRNLGHASTKVLSSEMSSNQGSGLIVLMPDTVQLNPDSSFLGGNFIQSNLQYPVMLSAGALQALGSVSGTGNGRDTMYIVDPGMITRNAQLADFGRPWRVGGGVTVDSGATLNIPAGVTVTFDSIGFLIVGGNQQADFQAEGTSALPIMITGTPGHGDWFGMAFANIGATTLVQNTVIERAGRMPFCPIACEIQQPGAGVSFSNASGNSMVLDTVTIRNSSVRGLDVSPTGGSNLLIRRSQFYNIAFGPVITANDGLALTIVESDIYGYGQSVVFNSGQGSVNADGNWWGDVLGAADARFIDNLGRARVSPNINLGVPATTPWFPGEIGPATQVIAAPDNSVSGPLGQLHAGDTVTTPDSLRLRVLDAGRRGVGGATVSYTGPGVLSLSGGVTDAGGRAPGTQWIVSTVADTQVVTGTAASVPADTVFWTSDVLPDSTVTVNWQMITGLTNGAVSADLDSVSFTSSNRSAAVLTNAQDQFGNVTQPTFLCFADIPNLSCPMPYGNIDSTRADTIFFTPTTSSPSRFMLLASYDDGVFFDSVVINMNSQIVGIAIDRDRFTPNLQVTPDTFTFTSACPTDPQNTFCQNYFLAYGVDSAGGAVVNPQARFRWLSPPPPDTATIVYFTQGTVSNDTAVVTARMNGVSWLVLEDTASTGPTAGMRDSMPIIVSQLPAFVNVTPSGDTLIFGDSTTFTATVVDQGFTPIPSATVGWRLDSAFTGTLTIQDTSIANQARVRLDSTLFGQAVLEALACCGSGGSSDTVVGSGVVFNPIEETIVSAGGSTRSVAFRESSGLLYVANDAGVEVVNPTTRTSATIPVGGPTYSIVYESTGDRVYAARTDKVMVINPATNTLEDSIPVGDGVSPLGFLAADSDGERVFIPGQSGGLYWLFVITNFFVSDSVALPDLGQGVAYNRTLDRVYVTLFGQASLLVIDPAALAVVDSIPAGSFGGAGPADVAVNPVTNRFYVTIHNEQSVWVYDAAADTLITTVFVGTFPWRIDVDTTRNRIYVARLAFDGAVAVVDGGSNTLLQFVHPGFSAQDVAINQADGTVFAARQAATLLLYFYVNAPPMLAPPFRTSTSSLPRPGAP
jgi:hypothetical protein